MSRLFPERMGPDRQVEGGERDELDAYWTPLACALACMAALNAHVEWTELSLALTPILEPAVGGGSWVRAAKELTSGTVIGIDIDAQAPGLLMADRHRVGDFFDLHPKDEILRTTHHSLGAVIGNPPYHGEITRWFDHSLQLAPVVAYLLRSTVLGSIARSTWWKANPPAYIHTLIPRPRWSGPGARPESDTVDSVFVVWLRGHTDTRHRWLRWAP